MDRARRAIVEGSGEGIALALIGGVAPPASRLPVGGGGAGRVGAGVEMRHRGEIRGHVALGVVLISLAAPAAEGAVGPEPAGVVEADA